MHHRRLLSLSVAFFVALGASSRAETLATFPEGSPAYREAGVITMAGDIVDNVLVRRVGDLRSTPARRSTTTNLSGFNIVIVAGDGLAANPAALAAFERAAASWEARISDSITVTINADLAPLGPGILGSTGSVALQAGYSLIRNQVVADALDEADDGIVASIPTAAQFLATLPAGFSLDGNLVACKANLKALGFADLDVDFGVSDGEITFSTDFTFDYDRSDGVNPGQTDFETVAAHEIGHLLGFFSEVDTINFLPVADAVGFSTLDLFRFRNGTNDPATAAEFTTFARNFVPGVDAIFDEVSANPLFPERRMSTGLANIAFAGTDDRQASHWKADELTGTYIGIMDPTLSNGVSFPPADSDFRALDLIGYDVASSNPPTIVLGTNPVSFTEDGAAILLASDATVTDTDSADFNGGFLSLSGTFAAGDQLGIRDEGTSPGQIGASAGTVTFGGSAIGTFSGGVGTPLQVNFTTSSATPTAVQALVRNLTYQNVSQNPSATQRGFSFLVADGDGGSATEPSILVNVTPINDPPDAAGLSAAEIYTEDTALNLTDIVVSDVDHADLTVTLTLSNVNAGSLNTGTSGAVTSTYVTATGVWTASGAIADVNTLLAGLIFTPATDFASDFTIATSVSDGVAAAITGSKAMTATPMNDAPTSVAPATIAFDEDTTLAFTSGNLLSAADVDGENLGVSLTVTNGTLTMSTLTGLNFITGDGSGDAAMVFTGTQAALNNALATLSYQPVADFNGGDALIFAVSDGIVLPVEKTVTLTVNAAADVVTDGVSTMEDTALVFNALTGTNGASADNFEGVPQVTAVTQGASGSVIFAADGTLTYTPLGDFNGADTFSYTVTSGGVMEVATVNVDVSAVNDAPTSIAPLTVSGTEDTTLAFTGGNALSVADIDTADLSVTLTATNGVLTIGTQTGLTFTDGDGIANETVTFSGAQADLNAALASLSYDPIADYNGEASIVFSTTDTEFVMTKTIGITLSPVDDIVSDAVTTNEDTVLVFNAIIGTMGAAADNFEGVPELTAVTQGTKGNVTFEADGTVTYSPIADLNGGDTFTYSVTSGGITETGTVTVTINPVNDTPTATNLTAAETYIEDTPLDLTDIVVTDPDSNVIATLTLSDPTSGTLSTGTSGSVTSTFDSGTGVWRAQGEVADVNTLLAGVIFTPAADFNSDFSITVNVTDGGGAVGGSKPFTGSPVNEVPSFTKGADITVLEDSGAQPFPGWATAISKGPANESAQALNFIVTANPTSMFATQPAVTADGTLTFRLAANANGTANITVALHDDGGTANGGDDTSDAQTFTITSTAVNDPPSFVKGPNIEAAQDAGPQNIPTWATAISPGPAETSQTVTFTVQVDKPELFATLPVIDADGRLLFSPAPNGSGIAVATVRLQDNGGTANGGSDTSAAQTFEIAVTTVAEEVGSYFGLVQPVAGGPRENARTGTVQLKVAAGGGFTGKLNLAGQNVALKGVIRNDGTARFGKELTPTLIVFRKNLPQLDLVLKVEVARGTNTFSGNLGANTFATIAGDRSPYTSKRAPVAPLENVPPALLGTYTVVFPALTPVEQGRAANTFPQGDGYGKLTVSTKGIASLTGTLADGSKISSSAPIAKSGRWPIYRALSKTNSVSGFATFRDVADVSDVDASNLLWFNTAKARATLYPNGWPSGIFVNFAGAKYTAPTGRAPGPVLPGLSNADGDGNAELTLSGGGLGGTTVVALSIDTNNRTTVITTPGPTFKLTTKTGLLSGKFTHPGTGKKVSFNGAVLQKQKIGGGFFLGPAEGGAVTLVPDATPGGP